MYAYIYIGEEVFRSNTVYFTFNIASSLNSNLYANIYYNGNKYPNPYFTNASQRYILCNQYEENGIRLFTKPKLIKINYQSTNSDSDLIALGMEYPMYGSRSTHILYPQF